VLTSSAQAGDFDRRLRHLTVLGRVERCTNRAPFVLAGHDGGPEGDAS
jgi:hypothetical protein